MYKFTVVLCFCFLLLCSSVQPLGIVPERIPADVPLGDIKAAPSGKVNIVIHNPYSEVDFAVVQHYKANLHTHTTESDGSSDPRDVIYHYHNLGEYDILAITDHNKNTWPWSEWISEQPADSSASSEYYPDLGMLAISGNEMSIRHHRGSLLNDYSHGGFFFHMAFRYIQKQNGLSFFCHPGRYSHDAAWYQWFFDLYDDCIVGIEVYNQGDRYQSDRLLWDCINRDRNPDELIWGFSNDDMHHLPSHAFRNYQHFLMNDLTEEEFKDAMLDGAFYFSYEPNGSVSENPAYGQAMAPRLLDVIINETTITITGDGIDRYQWIDEQSHVIGTDSSIDISTIDSNFVRAVLLNEYGKTYTQPFGIEIHNTTTPL